MTAQQGIIAVLGIIASVETTKHVSPKVSGLVTIAVALALGLIAGVLKLDGLDIQSGLLMAMGAIATDTTANTIAGK